MRPLISLDDFDAALNRIESSIMGAAENFPQP